MKIKVTKRTVCGGKRVGPKKAGADGETIDASKDDTLYLCTRGFAEPIDAEAKKLMKVKEAAKAEA